MCDEYTVEYPEWITETMTGWPCEEEELEIRESAGSERWREEYPTEIEG